MMVEVPPASPAQDSNYREGIQRQVADLLRRKPYHSLELPDGSIIPGLIGIDALRQRIGSFPIPDSLRERRVLDVGAASGWNSFEMARRGASVTAVDCVEFEELSRMRALVPWGIDYRVLDVDELTPAAVGTFDYVLFFGVLYHLRHPLLGLEKICALTRETAFVESFVTDSVAAPSEICAAEFYEKDDLGGQIDNWFGPTTKCLLALCRSAGFARVSLEYASDHRAGVTCSRRWEPEPELAKITAPWLYSAVNNRTHDIHFHAGKDEYLCIYFRTGESDLTPDRMRIEVDGYGVNALSVSSRGSEEWQVNSRLPPGLAAGEHVVRLRTDATRFGNEFLIEMLETPASDDSRTKSPSTMEWRAGPQPAPAIYALENSLDRSREFHGYRSERLCCRFRSSEPDLSRDAVLTRLDSESSPRTVSFLTSLANSEWQANVVLPSDLAPGAHTIKVRTRNSAWSEAAEFIFAP